MAGTVSAQAASTLIADARARNSIPRSPPASGEDKDAWMPAKIQKRSDAEGDEAMHQVDLLEVSILPHVLFPIRSTLARSLV